MGVIIRFRVSDHLPFEMSKETPLKNIELPNDFTKRFY